MTINTKDENLIALKEAAKLPTWVNGRKVAVSTLCGDAGGDCRRAVQLVYFFESKQVIF